jgi:uncharacterized membrane protein YeaQ/YmgE (transglycosylase-associated protein family)
MEEVLQAVGTIGLVFLLVVGGLAGLIASRLQGGRHLARNVAIGVAGALALPLLVAVAGAGFLAAGGLLLVLVTAAAGAVIVLLIAKLLFDR